MSTFVLVTMGQEPGSTSQPYPTESAARAAWLVAQRAEGVVWAAVERAGGDRKARTRCEWSARGSFVDRTADHRREVEALVAELSAAAPTGYSATVEGDEVGWRVVFRGRASSASIEGTFSDAARVRAHWQGYQPAVQGGPA